MDSRVAETFQNLVSSLEDLVRVYRHLLQVVRREKEILISANLDDLNENNRSKEAMLVKIKQLETVRGKSATELGLSLGLQTEAPRLTDLAVRIGGQPGDKLFHMQSVLELLLKRVQEHNRENEILIQSALANITGAMKAIRNTLQEKNTYQQKGEIANTPAQSGQLVSKEA